MAVTKKELDEKRINEIETKIDATLRAEWGRSNVAVVDLGSHLSETIQTEIKKMYSDWHIKFYYDLRFKAYYCAIGNHRQVLLASTSQSRRI